MPATKTNPKKISRARGAVRKAEDALEGLNHRFHEARNRLRERQRDYVKACGWVEESRYHGSGGVFGSWQYVYALPGGSRWHTLRGAIQTENKRQQARKRRQKKEKE